MSDRSVLLRDIGVNAGLPYATYLLLSYQGRYTTVPVDYHDGLQYPHLVRIAGTPDYLSQIVAARK